MIKAYSAFVALWGLSVACLPWLVIADMKSAIGLIISGLGLVIIGSAVFMWRRAGSEAR